MARLRCLPLGVFALTASFLAAPSVLARSGRPQVAQAPALNEPLLRVLVHGRRLELILSAALPERRASLSLIPCHYEL